MNVCYLVFRPDSLTYTVAKALSYGGHSVDIWMADPEHGRRSTDNSLQRIVTTPNVKIVASGETAPPAVIERLIIQVFPRLMEHSDRIAPLAQRARRVTLITAGDRSRPWRKALRLQWQELRKLARWLGQVDRIAYKDGFYHTDLFGLFKPRCVVGFDVHSQFLNDEDSFRAIHALDWTPESPRPVLANFLGSQDPDIRKRVLDSVRPYFITENKNAGNSSASKSLFWHEYSDAKPGGLGQGEFLDVLTRSDFTLCPPGYSLLTHRPMEALLRGSIPVLHANELELYDIGLRDGTNCIAVAPGQWHATMERLQNMGEEKLIEMRQHIYSMFTELVEYTASSHRMRNRLGVND